MEATARWYDEIKTFITSWNIFNMYFLQNSPHQSGKIPGISSIKAVNKWEKPLMNMSLIFKQIGRRSMNEE